MESVYSHKSERANAKNDDNKRDKRPIYIHTIERRRLQKNRKIVTESYSNKSKRDEMSDGIDNDTKEKELGISNSCIKVHILRSLVWLNLFALNSIKEKLTLAPFSSMLNPTKHDFQSFLYQTAPEINQYLASPSPNDQFAIDIESNNKDNNAVTIIKRIFLNIRHRSFNERLMEKVVHKTYKLFLHSTRHMSSKD